MSDEIVLELALLERETLERVRAKHAAAQLGEAFENLEGNDSDDDR